MITKQAGQFLVTPGDFLGWFNVLGIGAAVLMIFNLFWLRGAYISRLSPYLTTAGFSLGLGISGLVGILSTLLLTITSLMFFSTIMDLTGLKINQDAALVADVQQSNYRAPSSADSYMVYGLNGGIQTANKSKVGQIFLLVCILLLIIGSGYAFTMLDLSFEYSFGAMSTGIGLPEEIAKAGTGLLLLYILFDTKRLSIIQFRRAVLVAFGIAGLGFGAGEALKYFGSYADQNASPFIYGLRAVWCVSLHGAWTLLVGAMLATSLPLNPSELKTNFADSVGIIPFFCVPIALIHGLYNTLCQHGENGCWLVGGLSLLAAVFVVESYLKKTAIE